MKLCRGGCFLKTKNHLSSSSDEMFHQDFLCDISSTNFLSTEHDSEHREPLRKKLCRFRFATSPSATFLNNYLHIIASESAVRCPDRSEDGPH